MLFSENYFLQSRQYLPAILKKTATRGWHIEYSIFEPEKVQLSRKFIGLNVLAKRFKNNTVEFKAHANMLVAQVNMQLSNYVISFNNSAVERVHRNGSKLSKNSNSASTDFKSPNSTNTTTDLFDSQLKTSLQEQLPTNISLPQKEELPEKPKAKRGRKPKAPVVSRKEATISEVVVHYLEESSRELRKATLASYRSFCQFFVEWCTKKYGKIKMSSFDKEKAVTFLDYMYNERKIRAITYNNKIKMARSFFNWAKEKCYTDENPFENIKKKREEEKKRILIPEETRDEITNYLTKKNIAFLTVCRLVFASAIRPKEIRNIRVRDVRLSEKSIVITSDNAKNHHERYATINSQIIEDLQRMDLEKYPGDFYLFGRGYVPSKVQTSNSAFTKAWDKMRIDLKLPQEMQLYSLRDTGLTMLSQSGIDATTLMKHADHHDLSITTRYVSHKDPELANKIFDVLEF